MWCRLPGRGEFFSKGHQQAVSGTVNWARYEIPFYPRHGVAQKDRAAQDAAHVVRDSPSSQVG